LLSIIFVLLAPHFICPLSHSIPLSYIKLFGFIVSWKIYDDTCEPRLRVGRITYNSILNEHTYITYYSRYVHVRQYIIRRAEVSLMTVTHKSAGRFSSRPSKDDDDWLCYTPTRRFHFRRVHTSVGLVAGIWIGLDSDQDSMTRIQLYSPDIVTSVLLYY